MMRALRYFDWSKTLPLVKVAAVALLGIGAGRYVVPAAVPATARSAGQVVEVKLLKVEADCKYPPMKPLNFYLDGKRVGQ